MYKINYFSREIVGEEIKYTIETYTDYELIENEQGEPELIEVQRERRIPYTEYQYEIKQKTYETSDEEFEYWLDVVTKTYGKYGEVTYEHIKDEPTEANLKEQIEQQSRRLDDQNKAIAEMMNLIAMQGITP